MSTPYATHQGTGISDFAHGNPSAATSSPLAQSAQAPSAFHDDFAASQRGSSVAGDGDPGYDRSASTASTAVPAAAPARSNTLKKKASVRRVGSLRRSGSKRSLAAGSTKGVGGGGAHEDREFNSIYHTPIPTQGSPTEVLANRFQAWRQLLKSLIAYFREIQSSYDARAKAVHKVQSVIAGITHPSMFMTEDGLGDATRILDDYHKHSVVEANKSRDIENDVIGALSGLRSDLGQKIKEIKGLSGDFKNSVDKEKEGTKREIEKLQEALQHVDHEDGSSTGKNDPFVVKLGVDKMVERQVDEENYLHRAYLNLESSGRELESIVVGEIQKAYNALAGILKREGDDAHAVVECLRGGPIAMPKEHEWQKFVVADPHFVDPGVPLRRLADIQYPGQHHPAVTEVRAGMLERKSKYLKSYSPGWYVLSPTHLHEFKSADKLASQPPVMSLYLLDQKLGSKSDAGSSSNKFMLKGKQSGGGGGRAGGHNWVFRAETHETMLAWYEDLRVLTESSGEARSAFVRQHARSVSGASDRGTAASSDGFEDDEADAEPYRADVASLAEAPQSGRLQRPQPGGRFPSDYQVPRDAPPLSPSSGSSDADVVGAAGVLPGSAQREYDRSGENPYKLRGVSSGTTRNVSDEYDPGPETADSNYYGETPAPAPAQQPPVPQQGSAVLVAARTRDPGARERGAAAGQERGYADETPARGEGYGYAPVPVYPQPPPPQQPVYQQPPPPQQTNYQQPAPQQPVYQQPPPQQQSFQQPAPQQPGYQQSAPQQPAPQPQQPPPLQQQQQQPPFLGGSAAARQPQPGPLPRVSSAYGDWMTPAAGAAVGAGAGLMGAEYWRTQREKAAAHAEQPEPAAAPAGPMPPQGREVRAPDVGGMGSATYGPNEVEAPARMQPPSSTTRGVGGYVAPAPASQPSSTASSARAGPAGATLGGLESEGARETGRFPVVRHDTNVSISALHVPGEYPRKD
ncbi:phosphatidylinositol 4,5-bisphosphate-binding protein [Teratosphaeriaceae sp. CCFEE 6253]|nr:phosphatidylinositol 4,5-bisphosphate-binding protein [Teratosphaeriaceae sp. CCFEE 6253]